MRSHGKITTHYFIVFIISYKEIFAYKSLYFLLTLQSSVTLGTYLSQLVTRFCKYGMISKLKIALPGLPFLRSLPNCFFLSRTILQYKGYKWIMNTLIEIFASTCISADLQKFLNHYIYYHKYYCPIVNNARNVPLIIPRKNFSTVIRFMVNTPSSPNVKGFIDLRNFDKIFSSILPPDFTNFHDFGTFFASMSILPNVSRLSPHTSWPLTDQLMSMTYINF